ncbi:MAG TPA: DUF3592 domain-containing protein [Burkholderiales bacterium]|nr:DUF3592 domain-containing protein [Burkholderiales bacterium]
MTDLYLYAIKAVQWLMLLTALAAFSYGVWHLGDALWLRIIGIVVDGKVVEEGQRNEVRSSSTSVGLISKYDVVNVYRPTIEFPCPRESALACRIVSPISMEPAEAEKFRKGAAVEVRVDPDNPTHARPIMPVAAYFWPIVGFVAGLAGLVMLTALFYLHEGAFGRDLSAGISLFRDVRLKHVLIVAAVVAFGFGTLRMTVPWLGYREFLVIVTGDIRLLPSLLEAQGSIAPGKYLNDAETAVARLPGLGEGFASEALERAINTRNRVNIDRFLAAYADPTIRFPAYSKRALGNAMTQRDVETFKRLLELGFLPDDPLFDPTQEAKRNNLVEFERALREVRDTKRISR